MRSCVSWWVGSAEEQGGTSSLAGRHLSLAWRETPVFTLVHSCAYILLRCALAVWIQDPELDIGYKCSAFDCFHGVFLNYFW